MNNITNEIINEIRSKNDIINVMSRYIPLTQKGKNYFGVCPFHDDHSPSMSVSAEKQIYTCFSCGATGNVFTFICEYEKVSFIEAVKILGDNVGISIGNTIKKENNNPSLAIYEYATNLYQNNLYSSIGKSALEYLKERKLDEVTIEKFRIGLAHTNLNITDFLVGKKYDLKTLIDLGITSDNGKDLFYNRIIFPLFDLNGNVVGFSGRRYNTNEGSKYINTKETKIFKKGHILYNYHNARGHLKKSDSIIVMEGFMDVIRASTVGINNCVATMGTALTKENALLLTRISDNIILCFDGDEAGKQATNAAIKILKEINVSPKIIRLEDNLDPDEYILKYGKDAFNNKINNSLSMTDYRLKILKGNLNNLDTESVSKYIDNCLKELAQNEDEILIGLTLNKIAQEYSISDKILYDKLEKYRNKTNKVENTQEKELIKKQNMVDNKYEKAQKYLLYYMLNDIKVLEYASSNVSYLADDRLRGLYNDIMSFYDKYNSFNMADFISYLNGKESCKTLKEIMGLNLKEEYVKEQIDDYIFLINKYPKEIKIKRLEESLKKQDNPLEQVNILAEIMKLRGVIDNGRRN